MNSPVLFAAVVCLFRFGSATYSQHNSGFTGPVGYNGPQAVPAVLPSGHIADTLEVAAARNAHYAALAKAQANSGYGTSGQDGSSHGYNGVGATYGGNAYNGPLAVPVVLPSGFIADTEAVAAAKGAHFTALAQASATAGYHSAGSFAGKHWA